MAEQQQQQQQQQQAWLYAHIMTPGTHTQGCAGCEV
jgi:hypothetical protein